MKKIVLTGGPCSGKTTILRVLKEEFGALLILVPEVATMLLGNGFPVPGRDVEWSEAWQAAFQSAILPLQKAIEDAYMLAAARNGAKLIICDRGLLDGAAYTPGGVTEFCKRYHIDAIEALKRYHAIIHLESLAVVDPDKYGKTGNDQRFEPLERAVEIEGATKAAWEAHTKRMIIDGRRGIDGKISETIGIVRFLLTEA